MKKEKLSTNIYNEFIGGLNIIGIKIIYSEAEVKEGFSPPAKILIKEKKSYKKLEDNKFIVKHEYKLSGNRKGEEEGFIINVIYNITYRYKTPITKKIFSVFSEISLPLHTWPYFRQFVHEMTARMGLPPLTLDLLKLE